MLKILENLRNLISWQASQAIVAGYSFFAINGAFSAKSGLRPIRRPPGELFHCISEAELENGKMLAWERGKLQEFSPVKQTILQSFNKLLAFKLHFASIQYSN